MHLTPIRFVTFALALPFVLVVGTGACGQVTGLSNDYLFDLQEDGGSIDGNADSTTTDGPKSDAVSDATADTADAAKCSVAQTATAQQRLNQMNGAMACKDCLATQCCTDVDACTGGSASDCRRALSCRLDCTTMTGTDRHDCFNVCNSNMGGNTTPASYTNGVGACSTASCSTTCAFQ